MTTVTIHAQDFRVPLKGVSPQWFFCSIPEPLLCQPSSKSSSGFYLVNIQLNRAGFLFSLSKTFKLTRQGNLILPLLSLDSVFPHCEQECASHSCHSNVPGVDNTDKASWVDTRVSNLPWVTWQVIFPSKITEDMKYEIENMQQRPKNSNWSRCGGSEGG